MEKEKAAESAAQTAATGRQKESLVFNLLPAQPLYACEWTSAKGVIANVEGSGL